MRRERVCTTPGQTSTGHPEHSIGIGPKEIILKPTSRALTDARVDRPRLRKGQSGHVLVSTHTSCRRHASWVLAVLRQRGWAAASRGQSGHETQVTLTPRTLSLPLSKRRWKLICKPACDENMQSRSSRGSLATRGTGRDRRRCLADKRGRRRGRPAPASQRPQARGGGLPVNRHPPAFLSNSSLLGWCPHPVWIHLENRVQKNLRTPWPCFCDNKRLINSKLVIIKCTLQRCLPLTD